MSDRAEPFGSYVHKGELYDLSRDNTSVYTHLGSLAVYDHIYVRYKKNKGCYIWRTHESFDTLLALAEEHDCIMHLNLQEVYGPDQDEYIQEATIDLSQTETIPSAWL